MNDFFNRLFGKPVQTSALHRHDTQISVQDESDNATRHQLVQMLLRSLLRKHGIPAHWIELKILVVPGKKQGLGMYVHLILRQWDERLVNYAQAFQNKLLAEITRYEPKCSEWLHGISWDMKMGKTCPYTSLPDKPFWTAPAQPGAVDPAVVAAVAIAAGAAVAPPPAVKTAAAQSQPERDEHANLESLFAIRDQEITKRAEWGQQPAFEDTQPLEDDDHKTKKR